MPGTFCAETPRPIGGDSVGTQWETRGKNAWLSLGTKGFAQKKVLSLVLCVAMLLSVMVMSTGAAFTDEDDFSPQYAEAAEVLAGMKVMQGYDDGSFLPQRNITRAQVATMIYRAATSDVTDTQTPIYADYDKFDDVQSDDWFAGYVNYCGNAELIKGFTPTTFGPNKNVTGYQVLAMILRAVGYDANDEFTGSGWEIRTASTAQQLGMLDNVQDATLGQPATRELVAELIFQALNVDMVKYMPAAGYVKQDTTLGEQEFDLTKGDRTTIDEWGRPGYDWTYNTGDKSTTIEEAALATYQTAVTECDVADDTNDAAVTTYDLYVNSKTNNAGEYTINATDTTTKIGAQGRLTEVYKDRIVMIDTFLAYVDSVKDATFDAAGHLKTPATINLTVYDGSDSKLTLTNGSTNYTYTEGQMVLLNAYTGNTLNTNSATNSGAVITTSDKYGEILSAATAVTGSQTIIYTNADQHNINGTVYDDAMKLIRDDAGNDTANYTWYFDQYNNLIGATKIAADTNYGVINSIWWAGNASDGSGTAQATVTYMDGTTGTVTIGEMSFMPAAGAIGSDYAKTMKTGTPTYSTNTGDIMTISGNAPTGAAQEEFYVTTDAATNASHDRNDIVNGHLFQFTTLANGTMAAVEVAGNGTDGMFNRETTVSQNTAYNNGLIIDANTVFLIKSTKGSETTFSSVTGFANIANYQSAEVDYVNLDKDDAAEYVYIIAAPTNAVTDNLFYYAGEQISYDTATKTYTIPGYVDGQDGSIQTKDVTVYNTIVSGGTHKLYSVTITNGLVKNGDLDSAYTGRSVNYDPVNSNVYGDYNQVVVSVISGGTGDTFNGDVYHDNSEGSTWNFAYVEGLTQVYGEFTSDMSDKDVILVWNADSSNPTSRVMIQAYIVDKSTVVTPVIITSTTVNVTSGAAVNKEVNDVTFSAIGNSSYTLDTSAVWQVREAGKTEFRNCTANEVFVSGNTYRATITISVPDALSSYVTISNTNAITYTAAAGVTGTGTTITTDTFVMP